MADTKITALAAISTIDVNPATSPIPIVDLLDNSMAASGTTKKVTVNQILGSGGTATLASATITGDLTVRTNQLIANANGVGVGTTPSAWSGIGPALQVEQASLLSESSNQLYLTANGYFNGGQWNYINNASADQYYQIAGSHVWRSAISGTAGTAIGWSTLMTLNSTGLGVGMSPVSAFNVGATGGNDGDLYFNTLIRNTGTAATSQPRTGILFSGYYIGSTNFSNFAGITGGKENATSGNSAGFISLCTAANGGSPTARLTVDSSGNVGIGVAPSLWNSNYNALDIGQNGTISGRLGTSNTVDIVSNGFRNSAGNWVYKLATSNTACRYQLDGSTGAHIWYSGAAGTAGNTIAGFSAGAMTLDASGNLLVGVTSALFNSRLRVKTSSTSASDYGVYVADSADALIFALRNDGLIYTGTKTASPYNNTTGSAANAFIAADGTLGRSTSSLKYKTDITDSTRGLADVLKLRPVTYKSKNGDDTIFGGLIAEEVHAAGLTEFVAYAPDNAPDAIHYSNMVSLLVAAIKELTARVQTLETR